MHLDKFEQAQINLIIVGNGKPEQINRLVSETGYKGIIVTDPTLESFKQLNFRRNVSGILSVGAILDGVKAFGAGHRQKGVQGDALQLGGVALIDSEPVLHYHYISENAADHPAISDIFKECAKINSNK